MKLRMIFFGVAIFLVGFVGIKNVSAAGDDANCKSFNANFNCIDITTLTITTGCQKNLCLGKYASNANVQCCPIDAPVKGNGTLTNSTKSPGAITTNSPTHFTNPLRFTSVEDFLTNGLLAAIQKIIVVIAVLFIAIGSLLYVTAGANPDNAEHGKEAITAALIGLALALAGPSILKDLGATIGWGSVTNTAVNSSPGIAQIALRILNFILGTLGILALIMMVSGAGMYLTSAGDEDRIDKGKDIIKFSILGVILAMGSMVLVSQVAQFFTK